MYRCIDWTVSSLATNALLFFGFSIYRSLSLSSSPRLGGRVRPRGLSGPNVSYGLLRGVKFSLSLSLSSLLQVIKPFNPHPALESAETSISTTNETPSLKDKTPTPNSKSSWIPYLGSPKTYSRSPKVRNPIASILKSNVKGNPIASILKSTVKGIPALFGLNPASKFMGFTVTPQTPERRRAQSSSRDVSWVTPGVRTLQGNQSFGF